MVQKVGASQLLNDYYIKDLLGKYEYEDSPFHLDIDHESYMTIRAEEIEDYVVTLRHRIGNIPKKGFWLDSISEWFDSASELGIDTDKLMSHFRKMTNSPRYKGLDEQFAKELSVISDVPLKVVKSFLAAFATAYDLTLSFKVERQDWDGVAPLSKLFADELLPDNPERYIDQQYIDFLSVNSEFLDKIHWRNFERLCAEFFLRQGYEVELGTGRADGGVDIRVWKSSENREGPPLLLVQCKRYKRGKYVKVEYVKALWSDLIFEKAENGLIVTTSSVALGGKKICEARNWPLLIAEGKQVQEWVHSLWRHAGVPSNYL